MEPQHQNPVPNPSSKPKIQKMVFKQKEPTKTKVVNVKVKFLKESGYQDFQQWAKEPQNVYIGRNMSHYVKGAVGSKWANPFKVQSLGREGCIEKYREYIKSDKELMKEISTLKGKTLGCWCKPEACHGDVLAQLADQS